MYPSSAQALTDLTGFSKTRQSAQDITSSAQSKYDIPGYTTRLSRLRGLVGNLSSSIEAVDPSVTGRTAGSFVTEGQRQALVSRERAPILGDLSKQQGALGQEEQSYGVASALSSELAKSMIEGDNTKYQGLLDRYNASTAYEKAQEEKRQFAAQMKLEREKMISQERQARTAAGAGGYSLGGALGGGDTSAPSKPGLTVNDQLVYNQAKRLSSNYGSQPWQLKEFSALLKSAGYGNMRDRRVLQTFYQLRGVKVPANLRRAVYG